MKTSNDTHILNIAVNGLVMLAGGGLGLYFGSFYGLNLFSGFIIGLVAGITAILLYRAVNKIISKWLGSELGRRTTSRTLRKELKHNINRAIYLKRIGDYQGALKTVNLIIMIDPNFSEALLLKAQVLWEGFENHRAASPIIGQILMTTSKEDAIHQQALWLATDIEDALEGMDGNAAAGMN